MRTQGKLVAKYVLTNNFFKYIAWKRNASFVDIDSLFIESVYRHVRSWDKKILSHYDDVIMGAIASQITSLTIVYSTVYSGADQSKHLSLSLSLNIKAPRHWPLCGEFTGDRWIPRANGQ